MIDVPAPLAAALTARTNSPVELYELYLDGGTVYYSDQAIAWGGHNYLAKVRERSSIKRYDGGQFDSVDVVFANVDLSMAAVLLTSEVEGRRLIIRRVDRSVDTGSVVLFDGRMERVSRITEDSATVSARHILGSIDFDVPARKFLDMCPWAFKGLECGYAGPAESCGKSWARCHELNNTARYGGFRFIPHSGTYQYKEETKSRFLLLFSRKKTRWVTASYASTDDTPYGLPVPIVYGRVQLAGIVIQHEDAGAETRALVAFAIGKVDEFFYLRANEKAVTDFTYHYGAFGGASDQLTDTRFPDSAYPYNLLAYVGMTVPSEVTAVDPAPNVTAVIKGRSVAVFDAAGIFLGSQWTDSPVWCARDLMTLPLAQGGMGIPEELFDDVENYKTAAYCAEQIEDTTGDQVIFNPIGGAPAGMDYRRYKSSGVVGQDPSQDVPGIDYGPGHDDTSTAPASVTVRRFTMNVALARDGEKAIDVLFKKLLPSFRGFLSQSAAGKIQIRCERPVKNSTSTAAVASGATEIPCSNAAQWAAGDLVLVSPLTASAEVLKVSAVLTGSLQFGSATTHAHASGAVLMAVAMQFDDRNMVGGFEYPLSDRQQSTNRITIKYVDAPAGFEQREVHVNDYAHQETVHKVNNEDVDGAAIDNYFQAYRIGEWIRAKRRDLGKFCQATVDISASLLEIGDVVAATAVEAGLQAVPFRVVEVAHEPNDEVSFVGQLYSLDVYDDYAPQATVTVPAIFPALPPPGAAAAAPNVTAMTAAVSYPTATDNYVVAGNVTMPANTDGLKSVHIRAAVGTGPEREWAVLYGPFTPLAVVDWTTDQQPRPGAETTFALSGYSENADGAVTRPPRTGPSVTVSQGLGQAPLNPTQVTIAEVTTGSGARRLEIDRHVTLVDFLVTVTLPANHLATRVGIDFSEDGGANYGFMGWCNPVGNVATFTIPGIAIVAPGWSVRARAHTANTTGENNAITAGVESAVLAVPGVGPITTAGPNAAVINASIGAVTYRKLKTGETIWGLSGAGITWTIQSKDIYIWTTKPTVQKGRVVAGVWEVAPDGEGGNTADEIANGRGIDDRDTVDVTNGNTLPIDWWKVPSQADPGDGKGPYNRYRFRIRGCNRLDAWQTVTDCFSGAAYAEVTVTGQGPTLDAREFDSATLGRMLSIDPATGKPGVALDGSGNMLSDYSFEDGGQGWFFNNGAPGADTCAVIEDSTVAQAGKKYARIPDQMFASCSQGSVACKPGDRFAIRISVRKTGTPTGTPVILFNLTAADGSWQWHPTMNSAQLQLTGSLAEYRYEITIPTGTTKPVAYVQPYPLWVVDSGGVPSSGGLYQVDYAIFERVLPTGQGLEVSAEGKVQVPTYGLQESFFAAMAVSERALADAAASTAKIQDLAIARTKLAGLAVDATKLADLAVEAAKLANSSVTATKISNAAVGSAAIAALAVGTFAVQDAAIQNAKISALAVGAANLQDISVSTAKIQNLAVTAAQLANLSVGTAQIQDLAITSAKISSLDVSKLNAGTMNIGSGQLYLQGVAGKWIYFDGNAGGVWASHTITAGSQFVCGGSGGASGSINFAKPGGGSGYIYHSGGIITLVT